ncbi:MAG: glycosyltransferase family 39 protein, partial [Planctomycetes bacterium]|nr:glycosyltransferase family 39 protein [Planctomycetota bacterium]
MNERRTRRSSFWKGTRRPRTGTHLVLLILLALGIRGWLLGHTTVAARDSIGFIRYAWQLQTQPQRWRETLRANAHPPLYPLAILAASVPVRQFGSGSEAQQMQFSAQLASAGAGVLLVFPLFFLGRELFGRRVGFWGAALFQCLPVAARVTSDALSEGVFLLWTTAALACAVRGLRVRSVSGFAGCGLFSALAYLTRPEGLLTAPAAGLVLLGWQLRPAWRWPWRKTLACAAALGLVMLMTAG